MGYTGRRAIKGMGGSRMNSAVDLSIIIVNYNTKDLLRTCLVNVYASKLAGYSLEVIVCDNSSADGSAEMVKKEFPRVILIVNDTNAGFAAANNQGMRKTHGRYVLLLNSDTEVHPDVCVRMIAYMDAHKDVGVATCKLVLTDGSIDPACHRGFPTPWASFTYYAGLEKLFPKSPVFSQYHQGYKDHDSIHDVDVISGAFFLVRREVIDSVGMLDEDYFMYAEDIDWAYRIRHAGWRIIYNPTATTLHRKKQSGRSHANKVQRVKTQLYFYQNNKLFYTKHYAKRYSPVATLLIYAVFDLRVFLLKYFSL